MFLLLSVRHVGAHPDELQHGVSIQSSINLGKTFPRISRIRVIPSTQILARVFVYLPPFISQILDLTLRMVLIFILIYFGWRDTEKSFLCMIALRSKTIANTFLPSFDNANGLLYQDPEITMVTWRHTSLFLEEPL